MRDLERAPARPAHRAARPRPGVRPARRMAERGGSAARQAGPRAAAPGARDAPPRPRRPAASRCIDGRPPDASDRHAVADAPDRSARAAPAVPEPASDPRQAGPPGQLAPQARGPRAGDRPVRRASRCPRTRARGMAPVPIEVLRLADGGALLEQPGSVTSISYQAPRSRSAGQLTNGSFRASIDLSRVEPRAGAEPVSVPVDVDRRRPARPHRRLLAAAASNVRLDEVVTRGMPVTIDTGAVPEGIEVGPIVVEPIHASSMRGASSRLANVRSGERPRRRRRQRHQHRPGRRRSRPSTRPDAVVPGIEVDPPSVRVRTDVARQLGYVDAPGRSRSSSASRARGMRIDDGPRRRRRRSRSAARTPTSASSTMVPTEPDRHRRPRGELARVRGRGCELPAEVTVDGRARGHRQRRASRRARARARSRSAPRSPARAPDRTLPPRGPRP